MLSDNVPPKPITDIFNNETCIDRRKCRRTVPMKVLALGVGRTGTVSLRNALERLGYLKCYHMTSTVDNPPDCLMWLDALNAKYDNIGKFGRDEWDQLLGDYQAVCDWPACSFAKELVEAYPNAKVILSIRDVDSWHASMMKTIYITVRDPAYDFICRFSWSASMRYPMLTKIFTPFFGDNFPTQGKQAYLDHNEEVRRLVPAERLLEYDVKDGWGPLCEFLGEQVPDEPFPHRNDSVGYLRDYALRKRKLILNIGLHAITTSSVFLAAGIATVIVWKRFM